MQVSWFEKRDSLITDYYSQLLVSFSEPNLFKYKGEAELFRLTIDKTFEHYKCVRITNSSNGIKIIFKETEGIGGYFLGDLKSLKEYELTETEWNNFITFVNDSNFWDMPTENNTIPEGDGESLLFEANIKGNYHTVMRLNRS